MPDLIKEIAARIRNYREQEGYTQIIMSDMLNLTPGAYAKIERGDVDIQVSRLYQLAEIFKVDVMNLLKDQEEIFGTSDIVARKEFDQLAADLKKYEARLENFAIKLGHSKKKTAKK
ncbi:helix-turn-helix domain-containing protein [Sediminibacterium roseum]|uniref:Helix-turn-helix domain-containing protein n=1 Tax=Sediminibacterium roseum TaxID=1978412 RepID=A0ABW9ZYQ9_9BACT|nr:helix-turn-helix domain-containing protein [Sediminibacterium roseum]NCI51379.1 helix-turn-helix domain-containing protein [Sediminibacterium roseum]